MNKKKTLIYIVLNLSLILIVVAAYWLISQNQSQKTDQPQTSQTPQKLKQEKFELPIEKVPAKGVISLESQKQTYSPGEPINLKVVIQTDSQVVDGAQVELSYNPGLVKAVAIEPASFFSAYPKKEINPETGTIKIIGLQDSNGAKSLSQAVLAEIKLEALAQGEAEFKFVKEASHLAGYGGQELLDQFEDLEISIN